MLIRYQPLKPIKGRIDSTTDVSAFRWHQLIQFVDLNKTIKTDSELMNICFLGFCCDEGVRRNMGRAGAAKGPLSIRKEMANWPANFHPHAQLFDAGDILCEDGNMEEAQEALSIAVQRIRDHNMFPILLGGGHEIALGHSWGF